MKKIAISALVCVALVGCTSTKIANPIQLAQVGDESKSCRAIANEMQEMQNLALEKQGDSTTQTGKNVALGLAGAFLVVPWFFMDTGNANDVEQKAAQMRYRRLQAMAEEKGCPPLLEPSKQPQKPSDSAHA